MSRMGLCGPNMFPDFGLEGHICDGHSIFFEDDFVGELFAELLGLQLSFELLFDDLGHRFTWAVDPRLTSASDQADEDDVNYVQLCFPSKQDHDLDCGWLMLDLVAGRGLEDPSQEVGRRMDSLPPILPGKFDSSVRKADEVASSVVYARSPVACTGRTLSAATLVRSRQATLPHCAGPEVQATGAKCPTGGANIFSTRQGILHKCPHRMPLHVTFCHGTISLLNGLSRSFVELCAHHAPPSPRVQPVASTAPWPVRPHVVSTASVRHPAPMPDRSSVQDDGATVWATPVSFTAIRLRLSTQVPILPEELDRPELRGLCVTSFSWYSGFRAIGGVFSTSQHDRFVIFTTEYHSQVRSLRRGATLDDVVAEVLGIVPRLRNIRILMDRLDGFPPLQVVATTRDCPIPGHATPFDLRPVGGRVCTLNLYPGFSSERLREMITQECPETRRPTRAYMLQLPDGTPLHRLPLLALGPDFLRSAAEAPPAPVDLPARPGFGPLMFDGDEADDVTGLFQAQLRMGTLADVDCCAARAKMSPLPVHASLSLTESRDHLRPAACADSVDAPSDAVVRPLTNGDVEFKCCPGSKVGTPSNLARLHLHPPTLGNRIAIPLPVVQFPSTAPSVHPGDPPSLLSASGAPRPGFPHKPGIDGLQVLPSSLHSHGRLTLSATQLRLCQEASPSGAGEGKYSVFDRHRHHEVRKSGLTWSASDFLNDAVVSCAEATICAQFLQPPIPDLPVPQITLTPPGWSLGSLAVAIDTRKVGGTVCTVVLPPGCDKATLLDAIAAACPALAAVLHFAAAQDAVFFLDSAGRIWDVLPLQLDTLQWLSLQLDTAGMPGVNSEFFLGGLTGAAPTTLTSTAAVARGSADAPPTVTFVLVGGGTLIRLAPQPWMHANVLDSLTELLFVLTLQGRMPHRPLLQISAASPRVPAIEAQYLFHLLSDLP